MSKIYRNWFFHNTIAHPFSELVYWVFRIFGKPTAEKYSKFIHDRTLPNEY